MILKTHSTEAFVPSKHRKKNNPHFYVVDWNVVVKSVKILQPISDPKAFFLGPPQAVFTVSHTFSDKLLCQTTHYHLFLVFHICLQ